MSRISILLPQPGYETHIHVIDPEHVVGVAHQLNNGVGHEQVEHDRLGLHSNVERVNNKE